MMRVPATQIVRICCGIHPTPYILLERIPVPKGTGILQNIKEKSIVIPECYSGLFAFRGSVTRIPALASSACYLPRSPTNCLTQEGLSLFRRSARCPGNRHPAHLHETSRSRQICCSVVVLVSVVSIHNSHRPPIQRTDWPEFRQTAPKVIKPSDASAPG